MTTKNTFFYVGIGASAGGHDALIEFFSHLPPSTRAAYFVSTHLPRYHKTKLSEIISRHTQMSIVEVNRPIEIRPSNVYMPAENTLMTFEDAVRVVPKKIAAATMNRTIDAFLLSLAECFKQRSIGVILSGGDSDAAMGAIDIYNHGGQVIVQSPASSLFKAMPNATINRDHPILVDSPARLAAKITEMVGFPG